MTLLSKKYFYLYGLSILVSVVLSLLAFHNKPVFNSDGATYLQAAYVCLHSGISAARSIYPWPFVSAAIAWTSRLSGFGLLHSAYALNTIYTAAVVLFFMLLLKRLTPSFRLQLVAAVVILLWHSLNHERFDITRDQGFWAFFMISLYCFVVYLRNRQWWLAILYQVFIVLAGLYRLEGFVFLFAAPFFVLFLKKRSFQSRFKHYLLFNTWFFLFALSMLLLPHFFYAAVHDFSHKVSVYYGAGYSIFWAIFIYIKTFVGLITPAYLLPLLVFLYCRIFIDKRSLFESFSPEVAFLFFVGIIYFLISFAYLLHEKFLPSRYMLPLGFLCLLLVPTSLECVYEKWCALKKENILWRFTFPLTCLLMFLNLMAALFSFGTSHDYMLKAGQWLKQNIPASEQIYTNELRLLIFSGRYNPVPPVAYRKSRSFTWTYFYNSPPLWHAYQYLVLDLDRSHPHSKAFPYLLKKIGQPEKIFYGKHGDKVVIFKLKE